MGPDFGQDFGGENDDTPCTIYTRLARFGKESGGVFAESQLVKVFCQRLTNASWTWHCLGSSWDLVVG